MDSASGPGEPTYCHVMTPLRSTARKVGVGTVSDPVAKQLVVFMPEQTGISCTASLCLLVKERAEEQAGQEGELTI